MNIPILPLLLSLGAMTCWGVAIFFLSIISRKTDPLRTVLSFQLLGIPFILLLFPFAPVSSDVILPSVILIGLGIYVGLIMTIQMKALKIGTTSIISPLFATAALVTFFLSVVVLKEPFSTFRLLSVFIIVVGVAFVSIKQKDLTEEGEKPIHAGVFYALIFAVLIGIFLFLVAVQSKLTGWFLTVLLTRVGSTTVMFILLLTKTRGSLKAVFRGIPWKLGLGAGAFDVLAFSLYNIASSIHDVSYASVISSAHPLITVALAYIVFKERISLVQGFGIMFILFGVIVLQA